MNSSFSAPLQQSPTFCSPIPDLETNPETNLETPDLNTGDGLATQRTAQYSDQDADDGKNAPPQGPVAYGNPYRKQQGISAIFSVNIFNGGKARGPKGLEHFESEQRTNTRRQSKLCKTMG